MSFADNYVEQMKKSCEIFARKYFPDDLLAEFEKEADWEIKNNKNYCALHKDRLTTLRLYPDSKWCCTECADYLFKAGWLLGCVVFDMEKP